MNKKVLIAALIVLVIVGSAWYAVQEVKNVTVEGFDVTGISGISLQSFTINGNLYLHNPSYFSLPVPSTKYAVILENTGEVLSAGGFESFKLAPQATTTVPLKHTVEWVPTVNLVLQLLTQQEVVATVQGTVEIDFLGINYELPFKQSADIKPYVVQFAQEKAESYAQTALEKIKQFLN